MKICKENTNKKKKVFMKTENNFQIKESEKLPFQAYCKWERYERSTKINEELCS